MTTLKLTEKELDGFVNGKMPKRFTTVFDDLPCYHKDNPLKPGETHRMYVEDDGREYRWFIFKDTKTGIEYLLNYTFHNDWPCDIYEKPKSIEYVKTPEESDLYVEPEPIKEKPVVLTEEQTKDREWKQKYEAVKGECREVVIKEKLKVPKEKIKDVLDLLKKKHFTLYEVRALMYPICIDYRLEIDSLWRWMQVKRGAWKA